MENQQLQLTEAWKLFFKKIFTFSGRATRAEYWLIIATTSVINGAIYTVDHAVFDCIVLSSTQSIKNSSLNDSLIIINLIIIGILSLIYLIALIPLTARRLHDVGKSGWWQLLYLIPIVGWIILSLWYVRISDPDNEYGEAKTEGTQLKLGEARSLWWKSKFKFSGRLTRAEYWLSQLWAGVFTLLVVLSIYVIIIFASIFMIFNRAFLSSGTALVLGTIVGLALIAIFICIIVFYISLIVRRLHDIGKSGWWIIPLGAIPLICGICLVSLYIAHMQHFISSSSMIVGVVLNTIISIVISAISMIWYVRPSDADNKYGPTPKAIYEAASDNE